MPTAIILVVSFAAALGGALYWDSVQKPQGDTPAAQVQEQDTKKQDKQDKEEKPKDNVEEVVLQAQGEPEIPVSKENTETAPETPAPEVKPEPVKSPTVVEACDWVDSSYFADAAFVGDSLTQGIQLYDIIDTHVVANKGINLYTVLDAEKIRVAEGYTSVMKELQRVDPAKIYVLLGANDIGWRDETSFKNLYSQLVDAIQQQHPDAILYLQSMFPVTAAYSQTDNGISNDKLVEYNKLIVQVAEEKGAYYLDVASAMMDETGALPDEVSPDGMHLNGSYYQKWFDYLKTHVVPEGSH